MKFKFRNDADAVGIAQALAALSQSGFAARQLFPDQTRLNLARIYIVEEIGPVTQSAVKESLAPFVGEIEYVEGPVTRKPLKIAD